MAIGIPGLSGARSRLRTAAEGARPQGPGTFESFVSSFLETREGRLDRESAEEIARAESATKTQRGRESEASSFLERLVAEGRSERELEQALPATGRTPIDFGKPPPEKDAGSGVNKVKADLARAALTQLGRAKQTFDIVGKRLGLKEPTFSEFYRPLFVAQFGRDPGEITLQEGKKFVLKGAKAVREETPLGTEFGDTNIGDEDVLIEPLTAQDIADLEAIGTDAATIQLMKNASGQR